MILIFCNNKICRQAFLFSIYYSPKLFEVFSNSPVEEIDIDFIKKILPARKEEKRKSASN